MLKKNADLAEVGSPKQVQIKSLLPLCYPSGGPEGRVNGGHSRAPEKSVTRCDHRQLPICGWWPVSLAQFALSHVELKSGCGGLHSVQCTGVAVATQDTSNPVELGLVTPTVWAKPRRWQRVWDTIDSHLQGLETKNENIMLIIVRGSQFLWTVFL